jgi:hypothetical protein
MKRKFSDLGDYLAGFDPIANAGAGDKAASFRRIDETLTGRAADWSRFAGQRCRRAGSDDIAESITPHGFDGDIYVVAGNKIWSEADGQRGKTALRLRDGALAHSSVNQRRPTTSVSYLDEPL